MVTDAGYESEENSLYLEKNVQRSFIKPNNYESRKTRKWQKDIGRRENMTYLADEDVYLCAQGRRLSVTKEYTRKSRTGFQSKVTRYSCENCSGCPMKSQCIHGNHCRTPLEERTKHIEVSKRFPALAAGRPWAYNLARRNQAAGKPKYPGKRCLCDDEGRYELSQVPEPWHRECAC